MMNITYYEERLNRIESLKKEQKRDYIILVCLTSILPMFFLIIFIFNPILIKIDIIVAICIFCLFVYPFITLLYFSNKKDTKLFMKDTKEKIQVLSNK